MNEKQYLGLVASLGCIITGLPAQIHHPRFAGYMAVKSPDWLAIPLCPDLHRMRHEQPAEFEALHGSEVELLARTIRAVVQTLDKERIPF